MNVGTEYSQVTSARHHRDGSTKCTNNQGLKSAVPTFMTSSTSRAKKAIQLNQPKIMTPIAGYSNRGKYVASLSVIPKEKIPKIVVLPSIDKDIPALSQPRPISPKIPPVVTVNKAVKAAVSSSKQSPKRFVSCLHTSLSTEWKKDSIEEDNFKEKKNRRTSSLQIDLNPKITKEKPRPANKCLSLTGAADKKVTSPAKAQTEQNTKGYSDPQKRTDIQAMSKKDMDKQHVRIQYLPLRKSFTVKEPVANVSALGTSRLNADANGLLSRHQDTSASRIRPRMLPKSRFRVKIQKSRHKSINISDTLNFLQRGKDNDEEIEDRHVIIQDKGVLRSFSVQKPNKLLSGRS